jgi:acyl-CoA synthetase (AMP-forming)/AMP-acid ligase II
MFPLVSLLERVERGQPSIVTGLADRGSQLAVATGARRVTYAALAERVHETARSLGGGRRLVLLAGANDLDALVGYLAALHAGHPVLLAPSGNDTHLSRLVDAFDPDVLLTGSSAWTVEERRTGSAHSFHPDLAVLMSTSGSTGSPRLVRLSHQNLHANATAIAQYLGLTPADRAISSLPMHYCYGLSVINSHLVAGAGIVLTDCSVVDPCFWEQLRRHEVTGFAGVPHTFDLLDRVGFDSMSLPSLRYVTQAGGRLSPDRVRRYAERGERDGWDLYVMYGQTEATARMAYLPPALARSHPTSIGIPIPGGTLDIEPVDGADAGVGELVYRGPNVMLGYADDPGDLASGATLDALHTGDLARRTDEGLFEIVGRRSRFAKIFGLRIDLDHLEALLDDRSIEALCTTDDDRVILAVTTDRDAVEARGVVTAETGLPPSRVVVEVLPHLPRLANGKPDHVAVGRSTTASAPAPDATVDHDAPTDVDPRVHRAFVGVLHPTEITGDSTFVDLGGDSLSYVEMSIALEGVLGELPVGWHTTPIRALVPTDRPTGRLRQMETSVVLRAVAIVLVVGTHIKLFSVLGGAHLLLGIAGYNFARFQGLPADRVRSIARIAVPSMVWLAIASAMNDRIHLAHVLLLNGWFGGDDAHGGYWYVEAIVQILVPLALLLSIPGVRRVERAHRFVVPLTVLAAGLAIRFHLVDLPTVEPHDIRPHDIFWIFALGWVAAGARSTAPRVLVSALVLLTVPGYFGEPAREAFVVAGLLLLLWVPTVRLARPLTGVVGRVAAASLYIYLTHWQVFPPLREHFGPLVALLGAVTAGVAAWTAVRYGTLLARRWRQAEAAGAASARSLTELSAA